ncbi:ATP-binding cassette domain-containing protein, partial [Escherichia coli]|nr:ATP-binding cassette domain-containing protein [Escherichia coli]
TREALPQGPVRLEVEGLCVAGDRGERAVHGLSLTVRAGEIVGIAGVSGNGQRELMDALTGVLPRAAGTVEVDGQAYRPTRAQMARHGVRSLPEEPLQRA